MKQLCIIGAGPAGLMAAISAKIHHPDLNVVILDSNDRIGKKLQLTGGGRCNITADVDNTEIIKSVVKNGKFLYGGLNEFNSKSIQEFFINEGCQLKIEDHNRVFPKSNKSEDIINVLKNKLDELDIEILFNKKINNIDTDTNHLISNNDRIYYDYLIIATGGNSYRETGSDGSGYKLAELFGHTVTELLPAEVPLVSNNNFIKEKTLQGLSFQDVELSIYQKGKIKYKITHDLIFTHFGLSGPGSLRASFFVQKILEKETPVNLTIDFLPNSNWAQLELELKENSLDNLGKKYNLPKRLLDFIKNNTINVSKNKDEYIAYLKKFPMTVYTTKGLANAFVTNGGINIKEIDPKTMHSKLVDNLAFCGEILDMNAYTGGFNITIAFVTGYVAGKFIV